jgi:hypothetical protein
VGVILSHNCYSGARLHMMWPTYDGFSASMRLYLCLFLQDVCAERHLSLRHPLPFHPQPRHSPGSHPCPLRLQRWQGDPHAWHFHAATVRVKGKPEYMLLQGEASITSKTAAMHANSRT